MSEEEQPAGAGIPPQSIGIKRALEGLAMAGGPSPLNVPLLNLLVVAVVHAGYSKASASVEGLVGGEIL